MGPLSTIAGTVLVTASVALVLQAESSAPEWRVELRSSGGFTGRGMGGVAVETDGTVAVMQFGVVGSQKGWQTSCSMRMPEKIEPVAEALRAAQPDTWRERYLPPGNPDGCCDLIQWDLEISWNVVGKPPDRARTSWVGDVKELPEDVSRLRAALMEIWKVAKSSCSAR
jgi:hypothetical protein